MCQRTVKWVFITNYWIIKNTAMKKNIFISFLFLFVALCMKAQQTSMTIDNQTPGWLSSKINYGDQQTVENLEITSYINAEDLKFLGTLITNHSLSKRLDLSNVEIVPDNVLGENTFDINWSTSQLYMDEKYFPGGYNAWSYARQIIEDIRV